MWKILMQYSIFHGVVLITVQSLYFTKVNFSQVKDGKKLKIFLYTHTPHATKKH